jgi:GTPase
MTLIEFPLNNIPNQPPEKYYGNKEYKIFLEFNNKKNVEIALEKKATQMLFRIYEGNGIAKYLIGIKDNGEAIGIDYTKTLNSLYFLIKISLKIDAVIEKLRFYKGHYGYIFSAHVIKNDIQNIGLNL